MPTNGDLFYPAYQISRFSSILSGYIVTGITAAPFVFIDWIVRGCWNCLAVTDDSDEDESLVTDERKTKKQKALYTYDIPFLFSEVDITKGSHRIYGCSFFGKHSYGLVATTAGIATSTAVSIATFAVAAAATIAVATAALSVILVVGLIVLTLGAIYFGCKKLQSGTPQAVESIANFVKSAL